jgi:hypothetical protein
MSHLLVTPAGAESTVEAFPAVPLGLELMVPDCSMASPTPLRSAQDDEWMAHSE